MVVEATDFLQAKTGNHIYKSWTKLRKANTLSQLIGDRGEKSGKPRPAVPSTALSLRELSFIVLKKFSKNLLNVVYAAFIYDAEYKLWIAKSPFGPMIQIEEKCNSVERGWFSYPEIHDSASSRPIIKCLDGHHLLVNLRVKVCKDGLDGIRKKAWHDVARSDSNIISKSLVIDLLDKQRNSYARKTFSLEVEECMKTLGYDEEAKFTSLVRAWYEAEDDRSIPAVDRMHRRLNFRDYLLDGVSMSSFPPYGMYIKGFPQVMYEGFLISIDSHLQLYTQCRSGTYNQRAFSSLENETFFGVLTDMDPNRLGCPRAVNINRLISNVAEVMHYRQNPDARIFQMRTSRKPVYPAHKLENCEVRHKEQDNAVSPVNSITLPKNHAFDEIGRSRTKTRRKTSTISKPTEPGRGVMTVRSDHYKTNESKITMGRRLGIE